MSKAKSIIALSLVILLVLGLGLLAWFGIYIGDNGSTFKIPSVRDDDAGIKRGLDLVGGSIITYQAVIDEDISDADLKSGMDSVLAMMVNRLDALNYTEANAYLSGDRRITIEIPSVSDPAEAMKKLGATAKLEFVDSDGNVVLTGDDIDKSYADNGTNSRQQQQLMVMLKLKKDAVPKFYEATKAAAAKGMESGKNFIAIMLDGEVISRPYVSNAINSDVCQIEGDPEQAVYLANIINSGRLPFALKDIESRSVGASLGAEALSTSVWAAFIGILLVCIFMVVVYRIPGLMADIALGLYMGLISLIYVLFKVNISLPGVAGIILSIGMAVDANVVIFERIKEELRLGKTVKASVKSGFSRALWAIVDSNITTAIAAVVLIFLGTGPIKGFAQTLLTGVLVSMFTSLVITRLLLNCCIGLKITNTKAYGVKEA